MATEIRLTIPGDSSYLRLARLAAADVGSRAGMGFDDLEDLRIAVDELCHALTADNPGQPLSIVYTLRDDAVEVRGECDDHGRGMAPTELARTILAAVVDDYELETGDGQRRFALRKVIHT